MSLHGDLPVDDIEDIVTGETETDIRAGNKKHVVARARKHKTREITEKVNADSIIPGL